MKLAKQYIARIILIIEVILFSGFYVFGTNGLIALGKIKKEIAQADKSLHDIKEEVVHLQSTIALHKSNPFFIEKKARELQLAYENEEIYIYND